MNKQEFVKFAMAILTDEDFAKVKRIIESGEKLSLIKEAFMNTLADEYVVSELMNDLTSDEDVEYVELDRQQDWIEIVNNQLKTIDSKEDFIDMADSFLKAPEHKEIMRMINSGAKPSELKRKMADILINKYDYREMIGLLNSKCNSIDEYMKITKKYPLDDNEEDWGADEDEDSGISFDKLIGRQKTTITDPREALINHIRSKQEPESDLEREKREFYDWMVDNVVGVDTDKLKNALRNITGLNLAKLRRNIKDAIAAGKVQTYDSMEEDDDYADYGRYGSFISGMRNVNASSEEDDDDENISDEEAHRRFQRLLYGN